MKDSSDNLGSPGIRGNFSASSVQLGCISISLQAQLFSHDIKDRNLIRDTKLQLVFSRPQFYPTDPTNMSKKSRLCTETYNLEHKISLKFLTKVCHVICVFLEHFPSSNS
jgi:hypothetical protein